MCKDFNHYDTRLRHALSSHYTLAEIQKIGQILLTTLTKKSWLHLKYITTAPLLSEEQEKIFQQQLAALQKGTPIQYVVGTTPFSGLLFKVAASVLIPRPETEELCTHILHRYQNSAPLKILDIGCGCGCIAVSLQKHLPQAKVYACDLSAAACTLTQENGRGILNPEHIFRYDILSETSLQHTPLANRHIDLIVSNPPYIPRSEQKNMAQQVLDFEPHQALFVPDETPFIFYEKIMAFAGQHLHPKGSLFFEIDAENASRLTRHLQNLFPKLRLLLIKDMFDKERFLMLSRKNNCKVP